MSDYFNFNGVRGLSTKDRETWENNNRQFLTDKGYFKGTPGQRQIVFKLASYNNKFGGNAANYSAFMTLPNNIKDSVFLHSDANTDMQKVLQRYNYATQQNNLRIEQQNYQNMQAALNKWNDLDKLAKQFSKVYADNAGSSLLPLTDKEKINLLTKFEQDASYAGNQYAAERFNATIQELVEKNQATNLYHVGMVSGILALFCIVGLSVWKYFKKRQKNDSKT